MRAIFMFAMKCSPEQYWVLEQQEAPCVAHNGCLSASALSFPALKGRRLARIQINHALAAPLPEG
jgi:hypothetical protein